MTAIPTTTNIERARAAVVRARESLDVALAEGGDTHAARERLDAAGARLRALEAVSEASVQEEILDDLEDAADGLVREATTDLMAKLAAFQVPAPTLHGIPASLALAVIQARADDANTQDAIAAHEARGGTLRTRLSAVRAKREALLARRLEGSEEADDAATLALLDADARGLADLLHRHEASRPADPTRLNGAMQTWNGAIRLAYLSSLKTHAEELQRAMLAAATELSEKAGSDTSLRLRPNPALARAVSVGVF